MNFSVGSDYDTEKNHLMTFDSQGHCVAEMYSGAFQPVSRKETSCLDINSVPVGKKVGRSHHIDDVYRAYFENTFSDLGRFNDNSDLEKKKIILELLHIGVMQACSDLSLEEERFIKAYETVKRLDYYTIRSLNLSLIGSIKHKFI
ncbi:hypothetical protein [Listeria rocourtiae]|uniref:hypothetical protein n=1 Tax=Listeria rocourtiae TaxID=647910 RepID=UPI003D2F6069